MVTGETVFSCVFSAYGKLDCAGTYWAITYKGILNSQKKS